MELSLRETHPFTAVLKRDHKIYHRGEAFDYARRVGKSVEVRCGELRTDTMTLPASYVTLTAVSGS
jgi:hypothetical protein